MVLRMMVQYQKFLSIFIKEVWVFFFFSILSINCQKYQQPLTAVCLSACLGLMCRSSLQLRDSRRNLQPTAAGLCCESRERTAVTSPRCFLFRLISTPGSRHVRHVTVILQSE